MGERRRRRRSSESSRSRDRRRRSDRGRSRRSRTPERSERSQPSSLPPPPAPPVPQMVSLPVPSPGFVWQQVPVAPTNVHAGTATQSLPQHVPVQSWNQKDQWKTGWYSSFRPKQPWNKWKKESGSWGQQDTSHNIQEATPEEIKAAEQKKAAEKDSQVASQEEPDDGEYLQALWDSAKETAKSDPNRPRSAAELVTSGNLKPWWNMSWREITLYFPETAGYQAFLKEAGQETPPLVISRLSTVLAAFRYFQRPLEGDGPMANQVGPELLRFEVPGQQIIVLACRIPFPEYEANESCTHFATMSHGTSFSSVIGIAQHGGITVSHNKDDSFPSFGFSTRGSLTSYSKESLVSAVAKTAARVKFLGGVMVLVEATLNSAGAYPICRGWQRILARRLQRQRQCALRRPFPHCAASCDFAWHSGRMA